MRKKIIALTEALFLSGILLSMVWLIKPVTVVQTADIDITVCLAGPPSCDYTSISEAVLNANDGDVIDVGDGIYTENVTVTRSLTIQGHDGENVTVDGAGAGSVFDIEDAAISTPNITVTIKNLTIQNGGSSAGGGGIYNSETLFISDSVIQNNEAFCQNGGGIANGGNMTLEHVAIISNTAASGAGIHNDRLLAAEYITVSHNSTDPLCEGEKTGGGIENFDASSSLTLMNSVVSANTAHGDGGGIENGGALTVSLSLINGNTSQGKGGGIDNFTNGVANVINSDIRDNEATVGVGGGVNNEGGSLTLTNSVVYANTSSENGGGIHNESGGDFVAVNSTVSENHAKQGGGLHNEGVGTTAVLRSSAVYNNLGYLPPSPVGGVSSVTGTVTLSNTIVAHLFGQVSGVDCSDGGIVSDGSNLDSDGSCGLGADEISNVDDPKLGPLQDNGGPTWTHALLVASPAIDAASVCEATDQRGVARPVGNACDIGPFETAGYDIYLPAILK